MSRKGYFRTVAICALAFGFLMVTGCVSTRGKPIEQSKVMEIRKGETTKDQVLPFFYVYVL